jgi:CRP/FNR family transcriptional regulator, cyclic AMP receptor protein
MANGMSSQLIPENEYASTYLPRKTAVEYRRGEVIFGEGRPSMGLYLLLRGRIKLAAPQHDGAQIVVDVLPAGELFGESALAGADTSPETATALENVSVMLWGRDEVEEQIDRQPRLGVSLLRTFAQRSLEHQRRLWSLAVEKTPKRVVRGLLHFALRLGTPGADGVIRLQPLTHQTIAGYVGTSREIVTFQMNHLRRQGAIGYSRREILVYPAAMRALLSASSLQ